MSLTAESVAEFRDWLKSNPGVSAELAKVGGITQSTGLVFYDLQAPSEKAIPLITPLRLKIPRRPGKGDTSHRWKAIVALDKSVHPSVGEGNRGGVISTTVLPMSAAYAGLGLENPVTWEARYAAENFEDVRATATSLGIYALQQQEEWQFIGGMQSGALGRGATPTCTASATTGTLANGTYDIYCVPLTLWAYKNATVGATGLVQQFDRQNADGTTDKVNGGIGRPSAIGNCTLNSTPDAIDCIADVTPGAVAYAWYIGKESGQAAKIAKITTIPACTLTALPASGNQSFSALTDADYSYNDETTHGSTVLEYDGLLSYLTKYATNNMYFVDAGCASLASDGQGGVDMITTALEAFFTNYKLGPTDIWCSPTQAMQIRSLVIGNGGGSGKPIVRINTNGDGSRIMGGFDIPTLLNPFPTVTREIPVNVHPDIPDGTILFTSDKLPYQIQNLEAGPWVCRERQPFYGLEWPMIHRKHEMGIYVDANLELHVPFAFGAIQGVK